MYRFYSSPNQGVRVSVVGDYTEGGYLEIAVARCSSKDPFVRKKGRLIAEGRLRKGRLHSVHSLPRCTSEDFVRIAKEVAEEVIISKMPISGM